MYLKVSLKSLDFIIEDIVFKSEDLNKDLDLLSVSGIMNTAKKICMIVTNNDIKKNTSFCSCGFRFHFL